MLNQMVTKVFERVLIETKQQQQQSSAAAGSKQIDLDQLKVSSPLLDEWVFPRRLYITSGNKQSLVVTSKSYKKH